MIREAFYSLVRGTANVAWNGLQEINRRVPARSFQPSWSPEPLPKSHERTKPPLGFPRKTDSLCPVCTREVREAIVRGDEDLHRLVEGHPGEIPAQIVLRGSEIWMEKTCPQHGKFEDIISTDAAFFARLEGNFFGRDVRIAKDGLHEHGSSSIRYGRGAVLTVDLTNRCNMMCNPCFMDANQVGYVHELSFEDVKKILDDALSVSRGVSSRVQFSGRRADAVPHFLDAIRYAREVGYFSRPVRDERDPFRPGPRLRPGGGGGRAPARLPPVRRRRQRRRTSTARSRTSSTSRSAPSRTSTRPASTSSSSSRSCGASTTTRSGDIIRFAIRNIDKINGRSFQPVSFTGRDEEIDDETRRRQRYTLSQLAADVKDQAGVGEPMRDWFPLSASGPFTDLRDLLGGRGRVGLAEVRLPPELRHRHRGSSSTSERGAGRAGDPDPGRRHACSAT